MGSDKKEKRKSREREERLVAWWRRQKDGEEGESEERGENEEEEECGVEMFSKCKELVVTMLLLSLPLCFALASSEDEEDVFFMSYSMISAGNSWTEGVFSNWQPSSVWLQFSHRSQVFAVDHWGLGQTKCIQLKHHSLPSNQKAFFSQTPWCFVSKSVWFRLIFSVLGMRKSQAVILRCLL